MSLVDAMNVAQRDYYADMGEQATLSDNVSQGSAISTKLRPKARPFPGGTKISENFMYNVMPGGSHPLGVRHTNEHRQTANRGQWDIKHMKVDVVFNKTELAVYNSGGQMIYPRLKKEMEWAYTCLGMFMEIACYLPGQNVGAMPFLNNINGLAEIANDNSTASFDGNTYSSYADASRTDANVGNRIKGQINTVGGPISYAALEASYSSAKVGQMQPDLGLTTEKCYSYIKNKHQTQQRFIDTVEPTIGFTGLKFNKATIIASNYCPGTYISGTNDPAAVEYIKTTTATETGALTGYPTLTAETFFWVNTDDRVMHLYISDKEPYNGGFDPFIADPWSDDIVGRVRLAWQLCAINPRFQAQLTNIQA
jgi:hypothetical protein